jgi:hypothetical protein
MTPLTRICRTVGVGLAVTTATLAMTQMANAAPAPPTGPADLAPPAGNEMFLASHGKGVQIYQCNGTSWVFLEPRATLTTDNGQVINHSKGPTWTAPADGSTVTAKAIAKDPTNFDPATAKDIQQLLLQVTSPVPSSGLLAGTTYIQRINTQGGTQPPTAECKAQTAGKVKEVPYQADYLFFKAAAPKPA